MSASHTLECVERAQFADVMSELAAGVAVVTTVDASGPIGLTVTSLSPYTAVPPSLVVSVSHATRCWRHLTRGTHFGVHLLDRGQEPIAKRFAARVEDKFAGLEWSWDAELPRLEGVLAYMRCERERVFSHRDHSLLIGRIRSIELRPGEPLVFLRRRYSWDVVDFADGH